MINKKKRFEPLYKRLKMNTRNNRSNKFLKLKKKKKTIFIVIRKRKNALNKNPDNIFTLIKSYFCSLLQKYKIASLKESLKKKINTDFFYKSSLRKKKLETQITVIYIYKAIDDLIKSKIHFVKEKISDVFFESVLDKKNIFALLFFFICFVALHIAPILTLFFMFLLAVVFQIVPFFIIDEKQYCKIFKYILLFFITIYTPLSFYVYLKSLALILIQYAQLSSEFGTLDDKNCLKIDINYESLQYWFSRFSFISKINIPWLPLTIPSWFYLRFVFEIFLLIAKFSEECNLNFAITTCL